MPDLGPHGSYILASYAVTAVTLIILVFWMYLEENTQNKVLKKLENEGVKRRSAQDD